ncbi:hypothetical protein Mal15_30810 [Stieleria maiorica]|uniref:3-keto-alpha-glucoside-1,2-lyase/3-keto-2-hydroxy-glucal hydratase domain-containing protein n=1 Tax=Stieleria maiorica TaxID=2795974 RepID=A0A5B9MCR1_9BACT|nr:DUF1080 domain-containing protein [Stieleria maiorica]QEF99022.1 hypothetical protein Mal15_30810 [Stieleria maiorica]
MPSVLRSTFLCGCSCATVLATALFLPALLLPASSSAADTSTGDQVQLFDGKTLDGWNGDEKWFRVQDGAIIAGSASEKIPANQFLCTNKTYRDFELTVDAKLVGQGNNAGVQFRTKRIPDDTEVIGYQADIGFMPNGTCWGALYDESRRRKFLAESPEIAMKAVRRGDWNTLKIIARGDRIQIFLNGVQTVDYTEQDPDIERDGVIALQVHSGPPLEVHYRNIKLREL